MRGPPSTNLFLAAFRFERSLGSAVLPYAVLLLLAVLLITFVPALTLYPARLLGP